jgi:hypothetical protein
MASIIETRGLSQCACENGLGQLDSSRIGLSPDMEIVVGGMIDNGMGFALEHPDSTAESIAGVVANQQIKWGNNHTEKLGRPDDLIPATNVSYEEMATCIGTCAKAALGGQCVMIELVEPQ